MADVDTKRMRIRQRMSHHDRNDVHRLCDAVDELTARWEKACDENATLTAQLAEVTARAEKAEAQTAAQTRTLRSLRASVAGRDRVDAGPLIYDIDEALADTDAVAARYVDVDSPAFLSWFHEGGYFTDDEAATAIAALKAKRAAR